MHGYLMVPFSLLRGSLEDMIADFALSHVPSCVGVVLQRHPRQVR